MKNHKIKIFLEILLILITIFSFFKIISSIIIEKEKKELKDNNKEMLELIKPDINNNNPIKKTKDMNDLINYQKYYNNKDIIGELNIDGTNIHTLLVQSVNNKFYLNHSLSKSHDGLGTVFVDYRTDLNDKQINIYGHNSNNYYYIFKDLENYLDKEFYQKHKYIELWDGYNNDTYEIFSINIVQSDFEHIIVKPDNPEKHLNNLKESIYETNVDVQVDDKILILQTCSYNPRNSFLIVCAKKIS